jgi:hypothetical protein
MAMDVRHARARAELHADRERFDRYASKVAERLHKSVDDAVAWLNQMYDENRGDLVLAVAEGWLIEGGHVFHPEEDTSPGTGSQS